MNKYVINYGEMVRGKLLSFDVVWEAVSPEDALQRFKNTYDEKDWTKVAYANIYSLVLLQSFYNGQYHE